MEQEGGDHIPTLTPLYPPDPSPITKTAPRTRQPTILGYLRQGSALPAPTEDNIQHNQDVTSPIPTPSGDLNPKLEVQPNCLNTEECNIRRGGYCITHEVQGTKYWRPEKTTVRGKDGVYKYKYSRKVAYKCGGRITEPSTKQSQKIKTLSPNRDGAIAD